MSIDNPPAVDREALVKLVRKETSCTCQEHPSQGVTADCNAWLQLQADHLVTAILSSGILSDADEVRREANDMLRKATEAMLDEKIKNAELCAAVEALTEQLADLANDERAARDAAGDADDESGVRAADNARLAYEDAARRVRDIAALHGAANLREVKADAFDEGAKQTADIAGPRGTVILAANPYRGTDVEAGDE